VPCNNALSEADQVQGQGAGFNVRRKGRHFDRAFFRASLMSFVAARRCVSPLSRRDTKHADLGATNSTSPFVNGFVAISPKPAIHLVEYVTFGDHIAPRA